LLSWYGLKGFHSIEHKLSPTAILTPEIQYVDLKSPTQRSALMMLYPSDFSRSENNSYRRSATRVFLLIEPFSHSSRASQLNLTLDRFLSVKLL
jgi:hypothetical protein